MATSQSLPGFVPVTPQTYVRPVQVETAGGGLTGARLPNGTGILAWANGDRARIAVVPSVLSFLEDNVVTGGDVVTAVPATELVRSCAVYLLDGGLYLTTNRVDGTSGARKCITRIWQAADPDNPVSWSLAATLQDDNMPGTFFGTTQWSAGIPMRVSSGRWVMAQGGWEVGFAPSAGASGSFIHGWYSDGGAAGPWTRTLLYGHHGSGFPRTAWVCSQVGFNPDTSEVLASSYASVTGESIIWSSTNGGVSWTKNTSASFASAFPLQFTVDDDASELYAIGGVWQTGDLAPYWKWNGTGSVKEMANWDPMSEDWLAPGMENSTFTYRKLLVIDGKAFSFLNDRVAAALGGWRVGSVGMGS